MEAPQGCGVSDERQLTVDSLLLYAPSRYVLSVVAKMAQNVKHLIISPNVMPKCNHIHMSENGPRECQLFGEKILHRQGLIICKIPTTLNIVKLVPEIVVSLVVY